MKVFRNVKLVLAVVFLLSAFYSCKKDEMQKIAALKDRKALPGLVATKITTVVSDSGITRYRIYTDKWDMYDRAAEPYWEFKEGLHFEKFDENLVIDANFHSKYARYDEYKRLWEFKGDVNAVNLKGEMFETDLLYWDQKEKKIYSDKFIRVIQPTRIITAIGFESDESLSRYNFKNVQGVFAVNEDENGSATESAQQ